MALLAISVTSIFVFGRTVRPDARTSATAEFSAGRKVAALATVVLWLAIIFLGRAIAYDVGGLGILVAARLSGALDTAWRRHDIIKVLEGSAPAEWMRMSLLVDAGRRGRCTSSRRRSCSARF